jgi:hypothetical protein
MVKRVPVFFYGSFMRPEVMANANFSPEKVEVARLNGYDICLDPHANVFPHPTASIYGIVVYATHDVLNQMYGTSGVGTFLPQAVLVNLQDDRLLPVLCFMPPKLNEQAPDQAYLLRLIEAATFRGLPYEYIERLKKFTV